MKRFGRGSMSHKGGASVVASRKAVTSDPMLRRTSRPFGTLENPHLCLALGLLPNSSSFTLISRPQLSAGGLDNSLSTGSPMLVSTASSRFSMRSLKSP
jgi:hypothetical protein